MNLKKISNVAFLLTVMSSSVSARNYLSCEEMGFENCGGGGIGFFETIVLVVVGLLFAIGFFTNKAFRRGLLLYGTHVVGMALLAGTLVKEFGKQGGILTFAVIAILYFKFAFEKVTELFFGKTKEPKE